MTRTALSRALARIAEDNGFESVESLLEAAVADSVSPSVCRACGAEGPEVEPDATGYTCDECDEDAVESVLVAAGVM